MRVITLKSENFLRVRAVEIAPTGDVVKISGRNGEGKTSTIDSIWAALCLARLNLDKPIHGNAKKATIRLALGNEVVEILVERVITAKGNDLKVTLADGSKVTSPQKFLDSLIGELSFDPLAFDRMKPTDQHEQLRHLVKVDYDFAAAVKADEADFNRRQEINRQARAKRAQADGLPAVPAGFQPIDTAPLLDRMTKAGQHNADVEKRRAKRTAVAQEAETCEKRVVEINAELEELREKIVALDRERTAYEADAKGYRERLAGAAPLPELIDVTEARAEHDAAVDHNKQAERGAERVRIEAEADALEQQAADLTDTMDARAAAKEKALSGVTMPIPGLALGDGVVLYNDHPFSQASAAERLRVGMAIAMAFNPRLRVIRISDASLLDSKSFAIVGEMARDADFQVWAEVVDETKKIGIVIEDGAVAAVNK